MMHFSVFSIIPKSLSGIIFNSSPTVSVRLLSCYGLKLLVDGSGIAEDDDIYLTNITDTNLRRVYTRSNFCYFQI